VGGTKTGILDQYEGFDQNRTRESLLLLNVITDHTPMKSWGNVSSRLMSGSYSHFLGAGVEIGLDPIDERLVHHAVVFQELIMARHTEEIVNFVFMLEFTTLSVALVHEPALGLTADENRIFRFEQPIDVGRQLILFHHEIRE
jgi:hypothetical protein